MFYLKLAGQTIKKNKTNYLPFLLAMSALVILNLVMQMMLDNTGLDDLRRSASVHQMFGLGSVVLIVFTVLFSLYTNSILFKQRKKELGLYNILGMGKSEMARLMLWENVISFFISTVLGMVLGIVFSRLAFLSLKKSTDLGSDFTFQLSLKVVFILVGMFFLVYVLLYAINCISLYRIKPIDLLKQASVGEREPKLRMVMAILGVLFLGIAYYLSVTITAPLAALISFFVAILLVIMGTYLIFTTTSIAILKWLKSRKKYYYQPKHFINVSNMLYRMKQNGVGLASICILVTMVLVTITTTVSLYAGTESILRATHPDDISIGLFDSPKEYEPNFEKIAKKNHIKNLTVQKITTSQTISFIKDKSGLQPMTNGTATKVTDEYITGSFITLKEYQKFSGQEKIRLKNDELIIVGNIPLSFQKNMMLDQSTFSIKKQQVSLDPQSNKKLEPDFYYIVLKDNNIINEVLNKFFEEGDYGDYYKGRVAQYGVNFDGVKQDRLNFYRDILKELGSEENQFIHGYSMSSIDEARSTTNNQNGGFLFLGVIFGLSFLLATGLIIYYKQVSEGLQDKKRYEILQKVGMSHKEVRQTIGSQMKMVFFFPISFAVLHLTFALPILLKLLSFFRLEDTSFTLKVAAVTVLIFFIIYSLIYRLTATTYYKIVKR